MTREEAIEEFRNVKDLIRQDGKDWFDERDLELIDMAIEALSVPEHDGCVECRYLYNSADEYPCKSCKQNYLDMWEQKPNDFVSVVRCKDCRWYEPKYKDKEYDCPQGLYAVYENDFCSHGERREE